MVHFLVRVGDAVKGVGLHSRLERRRGAATAVAVAADRCWGRGRR